jgi:DNA replication protein DnaC
MNQAWVKQLLDYEEQERQHRSLERRIRTARIGRFKPIADFDWNWPKKIDREVIDELFSLEFIKERGNVVLVGPNGVGKSMVAQNLAHQAVLKGYTVRFVTASELLNDLTAQDSPTALQRRLRHYCYPALLAIDEVGYLSYNNRHADLLFEIISRRHQQKSTIVTTNKGFTEWNEIFPNSSCVVGLIDRLVHNAEITKIEGESYRLKEAQERTDKRNKERASKRKTKEARRP